MDNPFLMGVMDAFADLPEQLDSIGICICWLVMHIDGCQSVLSIAKQVKKSDRGAGATVSPVQMGHNGSDRRI